MMKSIRLQAEAMISPVHYYFYSYRGAHSKSELRSHSQENFGKYFTTDISKCRLLLTKFQELLMVMTLFTFCQVMLTHKAQKKIKKCQKFF